MNSSLHKFHIPVMGLAYTVDTPIKVARYGISSVISIVEDRLIEMMRRYYYQQNNEPYLPISDKEENYREKRITDYLNLVGRIVSTQVEKVKTSAFEAGSEIVKYFELLPDDSKVKAIYKQMTGTKDETAKAALQELLRTNVVPGSIDVNIMTKLDRNIYDKQGNLVENGSDAITALKGYANSNLSNSSIIFSAGMNPRLFNYIETLTAFDADANGSFSKKVVVKVSDFRSALIQGKYLAKKGIWVSEFRIESGLNCGGHAFATDGFLLGPILEEFKLKKEELTSSLFDLYKKAAEAKTGVTLNTPPPVSITVQGGIGTYEENEFLLNHYGVERTGWGSPFLLVPEATTLDTHTLELVRGSKETDITLSRNSPLGVRFHYLKGTTSHTEKLDRIKAGKPGSPCTEKFLVTNTEFTKEPICTASTKYQKLKIEQLQSLDLPEEKYQKELQQVLDKECLCVGLSNPAALVYKQPFLKNLPAVTICPGPNVAYFSEVVSLKKMVDHIYGRTDLLKGVERPNMFVKELYIYLDYLQEQLDESTDWQSDKKKSKYFNDFYIQLKNGITYYKTIFSTSDQLELHTKQSVLAALEASEERLEKIISETMCIAV